jgi:hypothetical protein
MLIKPLSQLTTADKTANKNNISNATCVLAVNGADQKRTIFLTDSAGASIGSFTVPRYGMVKIVKNSTDLLYAAESADGGGHDASIFVTFTKIAFTD